MSEVRYDYHGRLVRVRRPLLSVRQRTVLGFIIAIMAFALLATAAQAAPPVNLHCPDGWSTKDESGSDDNDLVLAAGTTICVKAGTGNTGILIADGETTLQEYLFEAGIIDGSGEQGRDVSYWVLYGTQETPAPTPEPSATPEPSVTPEPSESLSPEPSESITPLPDTAMTNVIDNGSALMIVGFFILTVSAVLILDALIERVRR